MVLNYNDQQNRDIENNIVDTLKLNPITDNVPKSVIPTIQPVFEVYNQEINVVRTAQTATTMYTTPSDVDFYLTNISMNASQAFDSISGGLLTITFVDFTGSTRTHTISIEGYGDTQNPGGQATQDIAFPKAGVRLKRNSTIVLAENEMSNFSALIAGYTKEGGNNRSL